MSAIEAEKQLKTWIRSQHLICEGTDFVFETVDQTHLEKFERCIEAIGGRVRKIAAAGNWPMGPRRTFKIHRGYTHTKLKGTVWITKRW